MGEKKINISTIIVPVSLRYALTMSIDARRVLIADVDITFCDSLKANHELKTVPLLCVSSGKEAQLAIADKANRFAAVVVNLNLGSPGPFSVIRGSRFHR